MAIVIWPVFVLVIWRLVKVDWHQDSWDGCTAADFSEVTAGQTIGQSGQLVKVKWIIQLANEKNHKDEFSNMNQKAKTTTSNQQWFGTILLS